MCARDGRRLGWAVTLAVAIAGCGSAGPSATMTSATGGAPPPTAASETDGPPTPDPTQPATRWLAYQSFDGSTNHIRLVTVEGTDDHELVVGSHPDWSPDGSRIAYEVDSKDIWVIDVDGSDARRVFDCTDACEIGDSPAWSPDGRSLAFTTADRNGEEAPSGAIVAVDVATSAVRTLIATRGPDYPFYPRWSPDGRALVISVQRFATTRVDDCSPVGSAVAVVDLEADDPQPRFLTDMAMFADYPDWSPDGASIVFTTRDLGTRDYGCAIDAAPPSDLYVIRPDGSGLTQLTHNTSGTALVRRDTASGPLSSQPSWTPDGASIVFVQVDGPTWPGYQVWTMGADGSGAGPFGPGEPIVGSHPRFQP